MSKAHLNDKEVVKPFFGKTIKDIDTSSCNFWLFTFTDGSRFSLEVESILIGGVAKLYGISPYVIPSEPTAINQNNQVS